MTWRVMSDTPPFRNSPEVYTLQNVSMIVTEAWQHVIMDMNPALDGRSWRSLMWWNRAFTNFTGYDRIGFPPRQDFINGRNLRGLPLKFDKIRCCPTLVSGELMRDPATGNMTDILSMDVLDGNHNPPSAKSIFASGLYFKCIIVTKTGAEFNFPQAGGKPVYLPLVSARLPVLVKVNYHVEGKPIPWIRRV